MTFNILFSFITVRSILSLTRCYSRSLYRNRKTNVTCNNLVIFPFLLPNKLYFSCHKPCLSTERKSMDLSSVIKVFEKHLPPKLAESWDNTGLLIEPSKNTTVSSIFFTNDLTETVLDEALTKKCNLIISYHPPIFTSLKSLKMKNWKDRIVIKCLENSIAVYSPHTSCDAIANGVNHWLINSFEIVECQPIHQSFAQKTKYTHALEFTLTVDANISEVVRNVPDCELVSMNTVPVAQNFKLKATESSLIRVMKILTDCNAASSMSLTTLSDLPIPSCGMGRIGKLAHPMKLGDCIATVKAYLNLHYIRVAIATSHSLESKISVVAVCAGSGSSVLKNVEADLYITGEMSHHDLLDANHRNVSILLCEHSNSERGYIRHLVNMLSPELPGINLLISATDKDPICIV